VDARAAQVLNCRAISIRPADHRFEQIKKKDHPIMIRTVRALGDRHRALCGWAAALAIVAAWPAEPAAAQAPKRGLATPVEETRSSNLRDAAELFGAEAIVKARKELRDLESRTGVPTTIATVETLSGKAIEDEAPRMAKEAGLEGVFILITKNERKIQVLVSHKLLGETMKRQRDAIRTAFIEGFREGNYDEGLKRGVAAINQSLLSAQRAGELPGKSGLDKFLGGGGGPDSGDEASGPLVLRNQVRLTLSGARVLIAAAETKANALKLKVNIAVVDDGGHMIAFERMDGARPASGYTAITKATSAATFRQSSGPIPAGAPLPDPLLNLGLQLAASASGGKITSLGGGVPVVVDGQVIGAIGVGGGTGEQDAQIATAGASALLERIGGEPKAHAGKVNDPTNTKD
jgi:glc operon protein GlcG